MKWFVTNYYEGLLPPYSRSHDKGRTKQKIKISHLPVVFLHLYLSDRFYLTTSGFSAYANDVDLSVHAIYLT